ncbi:PBP1A family penicillin-binding protein [Aquisalinus flavus]|nr:PBP1A family penicillin-binding protein [Aquisalinus flavus]UNE48335.1 PBP1A family penicillin-binding protein [Aquisalinus flavus]
MARKPSSRSGSTPRRRPPARAASARSRGGAGKGRSQSLVDRLIPQLGQNSSKNSNKKSGKKSAAKPAAKPRKAPVKRTAAGAARKSASGRATSRRASTRRRPQRPGLPGWVRRAGGIAFRVGFVGFGCFILSLAAIYYYSRDLPPLSALDHLQRPAQITLVDVRGEFLTRYGQLHGEPVMVDGLPPHVVQAFLATEDRNFYHHWGVNPVAIIRALIVNLREGSVRQGGSTITQQFAKNVFLTPDRTIKRKMQEMLLALQLEMTYSKDEILAFYLNNVYFGAGTWGISAASERYFEKKPDDLTVGEAAMLAGLLKAPSRYSPSASPDAARARAGVVLAAMVDAGYLKPEDAETITSQRIATVSRRRNPAPYATDYAMAALNEIMPQLKHDIIIHTTIDLEAHKRAQAAIETLTERDTRVAADVQVAMVALESDGAVSLLIGGKDYAGSEYNRATHALRQPGSAFKPFVYLAALEDGRRPDDIILDTPVELSDWAPSNYNDKYYGAVPMAEALARSLNAAAIRLQEETGRDEVVAVARRLGFPGDIDPGAALALGVNEATPLDLAATYLPFANHGVTAQPYIITSIYTESGKVLYARETRPGRYVVAEDDLIALNHMLRQTIADGSGKAAALPGYVAMGKTGTTQESRDAWFAGHAAGVTGVVWLGRDDYTPMRDGWAPVSGSGAPALLWKDMMIAVLDDRPDLPYTPWQPQPFLPSIFDQFRGLFSRNDMPADPAVPYDASYEMTAPPPADRPLPRAQVSMDDLVADVLEEEAAASTLPQGDELGAFLNGQLAEPAAAGPGPESGTGG